MSKICNCHRCTNPVPKDDLVPHPQDRTQKTLICPVCEYQLLAEFDATEFFPDEPTDYGSLSHGG